MKYVGLDPIKKGFDETDFLNKDGAVLVDFYRTCTLNSINFEKGDLTVNLTVTHDTGAPSPKLGSKFRIIFGSAEVTGFSLEGEGEDDMSRLGDISLLDDESGFIIDVADSVRLTVTCSSVEVIGL